MELAFNVSKQHIERADSEIPVAGSKNYLTAKFNFLTDEWTGTKTAIFKKGSDVLCVVLSEDDTCFVPWEVIKPGIFLVSVFCGDLVTANQAAVNVDATGYAQGETPLPPTPDVYSKLTTKIDALQTEVDGITNLNPVAKTDDMTQPVGVDANGGLYTKPGSGGSADLSKLDLSLSGTTLKVSNNGTPQGLGVIIPPINGESISDNIKPLTESWMIADGSNYALDSRNTINDTYFTEEFDGRLPGAVSEYYAKFDYFVTAGYCTKSTLVTVVSNGVSYPVNAYEFTNHNNWIGGAETYGINTVTDVADRLYNKPKILLTSGVHGNERMAPVCIYEFMKQLCTNKKYQKMRSSFDFYIIPLINPTGIESDVRRNYQNIDINRDTVNKSTQEMNAFQTYVKAKTNDGINKFLYAIDFHQAPSNDNVMTAFVSLPVDVVDDFVYGRFVSYGQEALKDIREYLGYNDTTSQRLYPWKGQEGDTIRNYMATYATYSMCWECSHFEANYTKSYVRNNPSASLIHNSVFDATCRALFDPELIGTKYSATAGNTGIITLSSISATKTTTTYDTNDTISVNDIIVTATYSDNSTSTVSGWTTNSSDIDMTTAGTKTLIVSYTMGEITKTYDIPITVIQSNKLEVNRTFNAIINSSGVVSSSTTGKVIPVYEVIPNTTYTIISNSSEANSLCGGVLPTDSVTINTTVLNNPIFKSNVTSSTPYNYTVPDGMYFLYLYHKGACEPITGMGFTVKPN